MGELILKGGFVLDPFAEELRVRDVGISGTALSTRVSGAEVLDVQGLIVSPGLVDLHTHVFHGQDLGVDADPIAAASGTTTMIDAGSAGGHLFGAFRASTIERNSTRIRAFMNVASIGTTSIRLGGELRSLYYSNEEVAVEAIEVNRDLVVGVKVRPSFDVAGDNGIEALLRARRVADRVGLPLMVHLGPAPAPVDVIAQALRKGDILTHAFTGWLDNRICAGGRVMTSIRDARERGVLLDVGHGASGFSADVAKEMIELGEYPDTISTDLHAYSDELVVDLPTVLSKLIALGMSLEQVLSRATIAPAAAVGLDSLGVGTLRAGAPADIAVFRLDKRPTTFRDGFGRTFVGDQVLIPVLTIMNGRVVYRDVAHAPNKRNPI